MTFPTVAMHLVLTVELYRVDVPITLTSKSNISFLGRKCGLFCKRHRLKHSSNYRQHAREQKIVNLCQSVQINYYVRDVSVFPSNQWMFGVS